MRKRMSSPFSVAWQEARALLRLALPISVAQAGQAAMGFVDTAVVGQLGTQPLAAVGLAHALFFAVASFAMGLMLGLDPLVSQAIGAKNRPRARALLWQGCYLALIIGVLLCVPLLFSARLLPLFGVSPVLSAQVATYLIWRAPSLPVMLLFCGTRSYLQAEASTRSLVVATVVANVANLGAVMLFVLGGSGLPASLGFLQAFPAMGIKGAALATSICTLLQWGLVVWAVRQIPVAPEGGVRRPVLADLKQALRVGLPIGLHLVAEVGVFVIAGLCAGNLGEASMSAHQIAISYASISFTLALGMGAAGSVRVGWAVGAGDEKQVRLSGFMAFIGGTAVMALSASLFAFFPLTLARLVNAPAEVVPLLVPLFVVCAVFQLSDGIQGVGAGVLRGAGDTRFTFIINLLAHYGIGLPIALFLGFQLHQGIVGIWWGLCAGLTVVACSLVWRFHRISLRKTAPLESLAA